MTQFFKKALQILPHKRTVFSDKNGLITIKKHLFSYDVMAGGCYQSGPYVSSLWKKVLKRVPKEHSVKNVLMLGLGGGGGVSVVRARFPRAHITVIEHDPIMVDIAREIVFDKIDFSPEVIINDANTSLNLFVKENRKFDVVIVDIFNGTSPSPLMYADAFLRLISEVLETTGYLLVNFYRNKKTLSSVFEKNFSCWDHLRYQYNRMAVYRHNGQGCIGDSIPEQYQDRDQSRSYLSLALYRPCSPKIVGKEGCYGVRYTKGPFAFERYKSDVEPVLDEWRGLRLVLWYPITKTKKQKGWFRNMFVSSFRQNGFARIHEQYKEDWSKHAKRHTKKWEEDNAHSIKKVSFDEFSESYKDSGKLDWILRTGFMRVLQFHVEKHVEDVTMLLVRNIETGKSVAGLATVDYPDAGQSEHLISFMCREAEGTSVGYGLIDEWYKYAIKKGISFLNFGLVWKKGDPKSWKGYSQFKRQFGLRLVWYPRNYFKITFWNK